MNTRPPFKIRFLDHVAIHVADLERSLEWYEKTIGLVRKRYPAWGDHPTFLVAGQQGIAVFEKSHADRSKATIRIDHFAFRIDHADFDRALAHFRMQRLPHTFQDHTHFKSLYLKDPDGHTVELTTPTNDV